MKEEQSRFCYNNTDDKIVDNAPGVGQENKASLSVGFDRRVSPVHTRSIGKKIGNRENKNKSLTPDTQTIILSRSCAMTSS